MPKAVGVSMATAAEEGREPKVSAETNRCLVCEGPSATGSKKETVPEVEPPKRPRLPLVWSALGSKTPSPSSSQTFMETPEGGGCAAQRRRSAETAEPEAEFARVSRSRPWSGPLEMAPAVRLCVLSATRPPGGVLPPPMFSGGETFATPPGAGENELLAALAEASKGSWSRSPSRST
jgi:hypothetical protein